MFCVIVNLIIFVQVMVIGSNQDGKQDVPQPPPPPYQTVVAGNARRGGRPLITTSKKKIAVGILQNIIFLKKLHATAQAVHLFFF
jgi:hypothetical protein